MSTPDESTLLLDLSVAAPYGFDGSLFRVGALVGFLGLEHETRRRNRVNGHITAVSESSMTVTVDQSFGNCPKYIQKRPVSFDPEQFATLQANKDTNAASDGAEEADHVAEKMLEVITAAGKLLPSCPSDGKSC